MTTAHIYFGRPINLDTAANLVNACRSLITEMTQATGAASPTLAWSDLRIEIASGGGDVVAAFAMFNEIIGMDIPVDTHNAGAVDSSAIMPFMAGRRRTASTMSAFMFHQTVWSFPTVSQTGTQIKDASRWLALYDGMVADTIATRTTLSRDQVLEMMRDGASLTPKEALATGIVHAIEECRTPRTARSWQV
jgi:ATP-dependent protease ClpP protease subunit